MLIELLYFISEIFQGMVELLFEQFVLILLDYEIFQIVFAGFIFIFEFQILAVETIFFVNEEFMLLKHLPQEVAFDFLH